MGRQGALAHKLFHFRIGGLVQYDYDAELSIVIYLIGLMARAGIHQVQGCQNTAYFDFQMYMLGSVCSKTERPDTQPMLQLLQKIRLLRSFPACTCCFDDSFAHCT